MSLSMAERERYRRHLALSEIGAAGQEKLKACLLYTSPSPRD